MAIRSEVYAIDQDTSDCESNSPAPSPSLARTILRGYATASHIDSCPPEVALANVFQGTRQFPRDTCSGLARNPRTLAHKHASDIDDPLQTTHGNAASAEISYLMM